jgi:hypothetical protein
MPDGKSIMEVSGDITMAMLQYSDLKGVISSIDHKVMAEKVAEVYKIIYKAVQRPLETETKESRPGPEF